MRAVQYAPFLCDVAAHVLKLDAEWLDVRFSSSQPLLPLEQLFCVLPPASAQLLPESYAEAMLDR
jgi:5'-3' exonuclease